MRTFFKGSMLLPLGLILTGCSTPSGTQKEAMASTEKTFDWQGHRGARGLAPENSIPGFLKALEFPEITTLELDLAVSADGELIVSHEPWMSFEICAHPGGEAVAKEQERSLNLYKMSYQEIRDFDCGSRGHSRFPEQVPQVAVKPTLDAVVSEVEAYCSARGRAFPFFNIEIKSTPEWDGVYAPGPEEFARKVAEKIQELNLEAMCTIQSFDPRPLRILRAKYPHIKLAYLIENARGIEANLEDLGFIPEIYSPYFGLLKREDVQAAQQKGMKVIPWTVNQTKDMERLMEWGVDGIITDYPNRIPRSK